MAAKKRPVRLKCQPTGSYDVGYCRPPVETRWQKGYCPNPKGRPRRQPECLSKLIADELDKMIVVLEDGVQKRVSKRQALAMATVQKAMTGDARARKEVSAADTKTQAVDQEMEVTLVFDEEQERYEQMFTELESYRATISLLKNQLISRGAGVTSIAPPAPSDSGGV